MLGADLSSVPVHRGPESAEAARSMQAKAFTVGREVHLPESLGSTGSGEGRATLAHELTHVVQQQRLGSVAPDENSPAGQAMESEARGVAQRVTSAGAQRIPAPALTHTPVGRGSTAGGSAMTSSLSLDQQRAVVGDVQRAALGTGLAGPLPGGGVGFGITPGPGGASALGAQRAVEINELNIRTTAPDNASGAGAPGAAASPAAAEDMSPAKLEELTNRLYDGIRSRLRHDLLIERERAGSLFSSR